MKKILPLILAVMLVAVMVVPVSATEGDYILDGTYMFNETVHFGTAEKVMNFSFTTLTAFDNGFGYLVSEWDSISWYPNNSDFDYEPAIVYGFTPVYQNGVWLHDEARLVHFDNVNLTELYGDLGRTYYNGFMANVVQVCDGSTCPATDVNQDNTCDDCGMMFAVLREYSLPDPYTVWTEDYQQQFMYAFVYEDASGNNFLVMTALQPHYENGSVVIYGNGDSTAYRKYTIWGTEWKYDTGNSTGTNIATTSVIPSFDLLNADGTVAFAHDTSFFPIPLWMEMEQVTQGEMTELTQETVKTMGILVLCGVGLMACLVVLTLFGKRSLIFRN